MALPKGAKPPQLRLDWRGADRLQLAADGRHLGGRLVTEKLERQVKPFRRREPGGYRFVPRLQLRLHVSNRLDSRWRQLQRHEKADTFSDGRHYLLAR